MEGQMTDENRKEQSGEMSPEFRAWADSIPKASMLCSDPAHRLRWSWKCSLCGVTGPRTLEAMNDHLLSCEKRPQSAEDALANALIGASGALKLVLNQLAQHEEGNVHADRALAAIDAALRAAGRLP
jgi:hypothetical protein